MRQWYVGQALRSFRSLDKIIDELTEEEVLHVLEIESGAQRRITIMNRLLQKAVDLNRHNYEVTLKEKFKWPVPSPKS